MHPLLRLAFVGAFNCLISAALGSPQHQLGDRRRTQPDSQSPERRRSLVPA